MRPLIGLLAEATPGTHQIVAVCGNGKESLNLIALRFYYCAITPDTLISSALAIAVTLCLGFLIVRSLNSTVPTKLQFMLEFLLHYVRGLVSETVADDAGFIIPLAATIGFYILVANWLDFFPLPAPQIHPATADLNQTLAMSMFVFLAVQGYSIKVLGLGGYLRRFTRPFQMHVLVRAVFVLLNIIEELVKPITLALRLFGNLFAGLLMIYLLGLLVSALASAPLLIKPLSLLGVGFLVLWKAFDVFFVGTIQAFIFMLLTIIYFGMAREGLEESHAQVRHLSASTNPSVHNQLGGDPQ
ncbi:MAG: F0F1 ATP synthase subunit A [Candidatus Dormibacteraceae bacterium]